MTASTPAGTQTGPADSGSRSVALDAARGTAILGILIVNIGYMRGPQPLLGEATGALPALVAVFAGQKFITLFAFLFGFGLAMQASRARERDLTPTPRALRRLAVLAVFGIAHIVLLWPGDVLLFYAFLGVLLLPFLERSARTMLVWAGALLAAGTTLFLAAAGLVVLAEQLAGADAAAAGARDLALFAGQAEAVYTTGTVGEVLAFRVREYLTIVLPGYAFAFPQLLAMALLGAAWWTLDGQAALRADPDRLRPLLRWGYGLGLPLNLIAGLLVAGDPLGLTALGVFGYALLTPAAPLLALAYAASIARLAQRRPSAWIVSALAAVGRMALSNYLLQSLLTSVVFVWFGWYGGVGVGGTVLLVLAVWTVNLLVSPWWLRRFRYGPVEWLWRAATDGTRPRWRQ